MPRSSGALSLLNGTDLSRQAGLLLLLFVFAFCPVLFSTAQISIAQTGSPRIGNARIGADQSASLSGSRPVLRVLFCGNTHGDLFPCPS